MYDPNQGEMWSSVVDALRSNRFSSLAERIYPEIYVLNQAAITPFAGTTHVERELAYDCRKMAESALLSGR